LESKETSSLAMKPTKKSKWVKFPETSCRKCQKFTTFFSDFCSKNKSHQRHSTCSKDYQFQNTLRTKSYA
jgi:hypothetical protein